MDTSTTSRHRVRSISTVRFHGPAAIPPAAPSPATSHPACGSAPTPTPPAAPSTSLTSGSSSYWRRLAVRLPFGPSRSGGPPVTNGRHPWQGPSKGYHRCRGRPIRRPASGARDDEPHRHRRVARAGRAPSADRPDAHARPLRARPGTVRAFFVARVRDPARLLQEPGDRRDDAPAPRPRGRGGGGGAGARDVLGRAHQHHRGPRGAARAAARFAGDAGLRGR